MFYTSRARAVVVHLNFRAESSFPVPVCAVPSSMDRNSRCNKVDAVRHYASHTFTKGWWCVQALNTPLPPCIRIVYNTIKHIFKLPILQRWQFQIQNRTYTETFIWSKVLMQGKLFQRCTHLLYYSVLSLDGKIDDKTDATAWLGINFHKNNILGIWNYYMNFQNYQNLMLLSSSDTRRTLMNLFLFANSAQRELVSICTQSIRNRN